MRPRTDEVCRGVVEEEHQKHASHSNSHVASPCSVRGCAVNGRLQIDLSVVCLRVGQVALVVLVKEAKTPVVDTNHYLLT